MSETLLTPENHVPQAIAKPTPRRSLLNFEPGLYTVIGASGSGKVHYILNALAREADPATVAFVCPSRRTTCLRESLKNLGHGPNRLPHLWGMRKVPHRLSGVKFLDWALNKVPEARVVVICPGYSVIGGGSLYNRSRVESILAELRAESHRRKISTHLVLDTARGLEPEGSGWTTGLDGTIEFRRKDLEFDRYVALWGDYGTVDLHAIDSSGQVTGASLVYFTSNGRLRERPSNFQRPVEKTNPEGEIT